MLTSDIIAEIGRLFILENNKKRAISRELNLHRNTVSRYVALLVQLLEQKKLNPSQVDNWRELIEENQEYFTYNSSNRKKRKLTEPFQEFVKVITREGDCNTVVDIYSKIRNDEVSPVVIIRGKHVVVDSKVGLSTVYRAARELNITKRKKRMRREKD